MQFTGERFVPGEPGQIKLEHLQRYALCLRLVRGKRVLDIASGEGYGSAMLARAATSVVGVDIDPSAVIHAQRKYAQLGNLAFVAGSVQHVPLADNSVDVVVSFETIEHHDQHVGMIRELKRTLAKDGVLILSSPNRVTYSVLPQFINRFHVKELDFSELESLLSSHFRHVKLFGQRLGLGCFTYALGQSTSGQHTRLTPFTVLEDNVEETVSQLGGPVYFLALCSDASLSRSSLPDSVILEPAHDLYNKLSDTIQGYQRLREGDEAEKTRLQAALQDSHARDVGTREFLGVTATALRTELERSAQRVEADRSASETLVRSLIEQNEALHRRVDEALTLHMGVMDELKQSFQRQLDERDLEFADVQEELKQAVMTLRQVQAGQRKHDAEWLDRLAALQTEVDAARETEARSRDALRLERESLIQQYADAARQSEGRLELLRRELDVVYQSKSWRLTAPLRDFRRSASRTRQTAGGNLERPLRRLYFRIPVTSDARWKIKSAGFQTFAWLLKDTASYQRWADTKARARTTTLETASEPIAPLAEDLLTDLSLPSVEDPQVSVVIPIYGQLAHTLRCLRSIQTNWPVVPIEVIVVNDASQDQSLEWLRRISGLRVISHGANQGFIQSCNDGARAAAGRVVLFLNNDTEVLPGWCDELWRTFGEIPAAGIVGSKLIYPDGRLQEAGGIIWRNGSAWNFGRLEDPARPVFNYRRDVDYVSGASLAVRRDLFFEVGAFDERYLPAYCEDSDLALKVRDQGYRVLYQPLSQVIHHEGVTSGRDLSSGVKKYQVDNARKLFERWRETLSNNGEPDLDLDRARDRGAQFRVLVLDHCTPTPDQDAGSITALNIMRILQRLGGQVTFIPEDNYLYLERYTDDMQRMGIEVLYAPFVTSVEKHLNERGALYDLVVIFRHTAANRHLETVRRLSPQAKVVLHTSDLHHLREMREADLRNDPALHEHALSTKVAEYSIFSKADALIVHSPVERDILAVDLPDVKVVVFGWAIEVSGRRAPLEARAGLAFVGGYQHPPNVDAAVYFAEHVFPLVRRELPGVKWYVVGSNPPAPVQAIAADDILVTGFVPDLGTILDRVRIAVAPLRYGAGVKGKVLMCMSYGVPNVLTDIAAEGIPMVDGEHGLIANEPERMAQHIIRLYRDDDLWKKMSDAGIDLVRELFSFKTGVPIVQGLVEDMGIRYQQPGPEHAPVALPIVLKVEGHLAYEEFERRSHRELTRRRLFEAGLVPKGERPFVVGGYCLACETLASFSVGFEYADGTLADGRRSPNWREHLVCSCGLNNRTRAAIHVLKHQLRATPDHDIYVSEQTTALYSWLRTNYPKVIGSEYLDPNLPGGTVKRRLRHEDFTNLSFGDSTLDFVLSFDVFEHVPNYRQAFTECARCLRPGGHLLFTVPFDRNSERTLVRARPRVDGSVEHILPPEYHGDPVNPDGGVLCFQHFGWDMFDDIRAAGFGEISALVIWSNREAYLGQEQLVFVAKR